VAPAQHVHVQMMNRLLRVRPAIDYAAEARFGDSLLPGHKGGDPHDLADQRLVFFGRVGESRKVLAWDDDDMSRRLWVNVPEYHDIRVLIHNVRRNAARGDIAKQTFSHLSV
jgi:hypothetical protein